MKSNIHIRKAEQRDEEAVWTIIHRVIASGDTYVFEPGTPRDRMIPYWFAKQTYTYVAEIEDQVVGTYIMKDNQPGLGSHIANASYMVHPDFHGRGLGKALGAHSIGEAKMLGYKALQFNIVVKTNEVAVTLWEKLGFEIIGEIPKAFDHARLGYVPAYIMYRSVE